MTALFTGAGFTLGSALILDSLAERRTAFGDTGVLFASDTGVVDVDVELVDGDELSELEMDDTTGVECRRANVRRLVRELGGEDGEDGAEERSLANLVSLAGVEGAKGVDEEGIKEGVEVRGRPCGQIHNPSERRFNPTD